MKFAGFTLVLFLSLSACISQSGQRDVASETVTSSEDASPNGKPCGVDHGICVTIDRNPSVQKMVVYRDGVATQTFPVSTGRETFDIPTNFNKSAGCSMTPLGTFNAGLMRETHFSGTWLVKDEKTGEYKDGAPMNHAIQLEGTSGVFIHDAGTVDAAIALGPKNGNLTGGSGGCIRVFPNDGATLFSELASCQVYQERKVCMTRDVASPENRNHRGTLKDCPTCPACIDFSKQKEKVCSLYTKDSTSCSKSNIDCTNQSQIEDLQKNNPELYKEYLQIPVVKNGTPFKIQVLDTRSAAEIAAVKKKCENDKATYNQRKAECLMPKLGQKLAGNQLTTYEASRAQWEKDPTANASFKKLFETTLSAQPKSTRDSLNAECNKQLYAEASKRTATPANKTNANSSESPPLKPPLPRKKFGDTRLGQWLGNLFSSKN